MKFSYRWLKELVPIKESPEKIAELLNLHSFEVETVEKIGNDFMLDAKIPANRISDAGDHIGLAKEIGAILERNTTLPPEYKLKMARQTETPTVTIANPELCPRYTAIVLELKKHGTSPPWMQERLITCGIRPINVVVDVTNYVMLETGQPLHAFDLDKISRINADSNTDQRGNIGANLRSDLRESVALTVRGAKKGETITTLDGTKHQLPQGTIIIAAGERLIDLAGIMGGENSAVSEDTKRILLQAATFDPVRIYRATRALHFSSDAAKIYSAGSDPNKTAGALGRTTALLLEIGVVDGPRAFLDIYPEKVKPKMISFRPARADAIIGQALGRKFYQKVLERLSFKKRGGKEQWIVEVPTQRRDLEREEDLIEEMARLYGYWKLAPKLPEGRLVPASRNDEAWWERRVADYLVGAGFTESHLYEFTGDQELNRFAIDRANTVALESPMNPETQYLVPRLLIKYIASAAENLRNFNSVKIFGVGKSFTGIRNQESGISERKDVILTLARKGASGSAEEEFYQFKGVIDALLESVGIRDHWYDDRMELGTGNWELGKIFHPYRVAEIKIGDEKIGMIGEIHPAILENIKSRARIVAAEIDFSKLASLATAESEYHPIGKYPAVIRDIAMVAPAETKTESVLNVIKNVGGPLLTDTDLFDYFQDDTMREEEEKSLAFHLIFQSSERTLTDAEVDAAIKKITAALHEKGWQVRT